MPAINLLLPREGLVSNLVFLQHRWLAERPAFQRVLQALPLNEFGYRPHDRSPSAAQILWTLSLEAKACSEFISARESNWAPDPPPVEPEKVVAAFERNAVELGEHIARLDESAWESKTRLLVHGNVAWEAPLGELLWFMFFDSIHHRGQLSTYIRPMGGKVPSIYGPSGDSSGA